jgi:hypothetical protein
MRKFENSRKIRKLNETIHIYIFFIHNNYCTDKKKSETENIIFSSSPSFYSGFKIELDNNSRRKLLQFPMNIH